MTVVPALVVPLVPPSGADWLVLTGLVLDAAVALDWVGMPDCGGVVGFLGVVRDNAEGRTGVYAVEYEAYGAPVLRRLGELATAVRARVPMLGRVALWHRVGRVPLGETSVVVAVSAPHRAEAFDACRYLIDDLKVTLPIWKYEHWAGGQGWSPSAKALQPVGSSGEPAGGDAEPAEPAGADAEPAEPAEPAGADAEPAPADADPAPATGRGDRAQQ
ncbi:MAG: molybdenum cofactor biosynthesis protein MoaE [Acidimicrobiales bacterium]